MKNDTCIYPIDQTCAQINTIEFEGNMIHRSWKDFIRHKDRPDLNAMYLLSEIVHCYRKNSKISENMIQKSYEELENSTGFSKKQIRESLIRLEKINLIKRHLLTLNLKCMEGNHIKLPNSLFIEIFPDKIKLITI